MNIQLENIGKIEKANIDVDGITIIAGENNTGKSTIGKALFCAFNGLYDIEKRISRQRSTTLLNILIRSVRVDREYDVKIFLLRECSKKIIDNEEKYLNEKELIHLLISLNEQGNYFDKGSVEKIADDIIAYLSIEHDAILNRLLEKIFSIEFNNQIRNIYLDEYKDSMIDLTIKETKIHFSFDNDNNITLDNARSLRSELVYIDDPFILDEVRRVKLSHPSIPKTHRTHLVNKLLLNNQSNNNPDDEVKQIIDELLVEKRLTKTLENINKICSGNLYMQNRGELFYKRNNSDKGLNVQNLSTGIKSFVLMKTLIENGTIGDNGTIVLDEPEIHLHPEWQIAFAEIIVLLQKEYNLHILITTHSPYFLNALEVYSAKYKIAHKCKYYLAENKGSTSILRNVTDGTLLNEVYQMLGRPLQKLEDIRSEVETDE